MRVLLHATPDRPALDMALTHALLRRVASGEEPETLRAFVPGPTLAFGRLDRLRPGFGAAAAAAREHGYEAVLRLGGGHAAAYDVGSVVIEHLVPTATIADGLQGRFQALADGIVAGLRALGVDAQVGELPGEYCPGSWSVHAGGMKIAGAAQRAVRGAALATAFVAVDGGDRLRAVLTDVYAALGLDWDPATAGALEHGDPAAVRNALVTAVAGEGAAGDGDLGAPTVDLARRLHLEHLA